MTKQIEAETLREWLDAQQPVTVLDIRTDEDRANGPSRAACTSTPTRRCARDSRARSPIRLFRPIARW